jgi:thioredoxin reductase
MRAARVSANRLPPRSSTKDTVAIVGAGPYGLAAAAHLKRAGLDVVVFGEPMETWLRHMPDGMLLRSHAQASHIADPDGALGLDAFLGARDLSFSGAIPLPTFVEYGLWFQREVAPDVDRRRVRGLTTCGDEFDLTLEDGARFGAARVVVAAGIVPFAWRPTEFAGLPPDYASHTSDHTDLARLADGPIVVVGGGQSALESAALLTEAGRSVELLIRGRSIRWLPASGPRTRIPLASYAYDRIGIGGLRSSWLFASPRLFSHLPESWRTASAEQAIGPAGADWLQARLELVPVTFGRFTKAVSARNGEVVLHLDDGSSRTAAHVLLATGYRIDVRRYTFLSPELLQRIPTRGGAPLLRAGYEAARLPKLHFLGAAAAETFGPVNRFVSGTWAAARSVTRAASGGRTRRGGFSW